MCVAIRSAVIDDQNDYYEFEGNVWLTEEQKREKAKRRAEVEKALDQRG